MAAGRKEWEETLALLDEKALKEPNVEGIWSVKEVIAHICAFEQYMAALLNDQKGADAQAGAGNPAGIPAGSMTAALDAYYQTQLTMYRVDHPNLPAQLQEVHGDQVNEVFVAAFRFKRPNEVRAMEQHAYQDLLQAIDPWTDVELNEPYTPNGGTLMQIIPRQCYVHYRQHIPAIRAWLARRQA